jgi:type I restriction enzyme M protein
MLPMTVLRRFDCVLAPTKPAVIKKYEQIKDGAVKNIDPILNKVAGGGTDLGFHNHSSLDFPKLKGDPDNVGRHLADYIAGFSENVRTIFDFFDFDNEIERLEESNRLYLVVSKFAEMDLHPQIVDNIAMGLIFEDLIRRFNEAANETAGDHFTPREVIRLMVNLLLEPDEQILTTKGVIATICDPACGTGGMLSEAQNWIREHNEHAQVIVFGQDYNKRSYAVAASDLLMKGHRDSRIEYGNSLTDDKFKEMRFDYLLANPPFGVDWKAEQKQIERFNDFYGYPGKLPRVNDGALLFLLQMIGHFEHVKPGQQKHGSRCAIVFNGSPLFTGAAGSGESEIRRWIIEHDWLSAIVALPEQMFYNTGIGTFIWIVTNHKEQSRAGKVQLIDCRERWEPMRRSLGDKRRYLTEQIIEDITIEHGKFSQTETCKVLDNSDFGYRRVAIDRPLRLRLHITSEGREAFLDTFPSLLEFVNAIQDEFGSEPHNDWNEIWEKVLLISKEADVKWTSPLRKSFRDCFAEINPEAVPVISRRVKPSEWQESRFFIEQASLAGLTLSEIAGIYGTYPQNTAKKQTAHRFESDPKLRDFDNVPLKENSVNFFLREVRPFLSDAWIDAEFVDEKDGNVGKVGYEINFNRIFFEYQSPRPLDQIDMELEQVEKRVLQLLKELSK